MSYGIIDRPKASDIKIKTSTDFELAYLRHQYLRRAKYNPTELEMRPYIGIVQNFSKNTFFVYQNLFRSVGLGLEDVLSIGQIQIVSFIGLYALERTSDKMKAFKDTFALKNFKDPEEKDFEQKNKANFTMFFKQRMEDVVRVCRQKVRNIKGQPSEEFLVFCGSEKPPKQYKRIEKEYEELGYKKVDLSVFKSIRKKANVNYDATIFEFAGLWYVAIPLEQKALGLEDIVSSGSDPYQNFHNKQPDDLLREKELDLLTNHFNGRAKSIRATVIQKFIAKNKNNCQYRDEINTARKLLKELRA